MAISVNTIPSINLPFTDSKGRISPIWHEFLRSFVAATVDGTIAEAVNTTSITAGAGLTGGGTGNVTLNVGAGSGITVNEDDIGVDFLSPPSAAVALDDTLLFADYSENNTIAKTAVRKLIELNAPGGLDTQVQYNNNGIFAADSGYTYDGAGTATLSTGITVGDMTIIDAATTIIRFDGTTSAGVAPKINSDGSGNFNLTAGVSGSETGGLGFGAAGVITFTFNGGRTITMSAVGGVVFGGNLSLQRCSARPTASTTQTQGQGPILVDYVNVETVANDSDTVTLPTASAGRFCVVNNAGAKILKVFPASGDDLGAGANTAITLQVGECYSWFTADATTWRPITGIIKNSVAAGITASVTQTQGQQPLTKDVNEISIVANANDTVTLPSAQAYSKTITIINNGANVLQIFPASGDNAGAGVDTAITLAAGANLRLVNYNITNWEVV